MWPSQYASFLSFLEETLEGHHLIDSTAFTLAFPTYDLMPFDYLDFAEAELEKNTSAARINCIAHLKRAIECELDTFLQVFGLGSVAKNLPQKLQFASDAGLFSSRSIGKLNKARNKLEHEYAVPESLELESYFDIATGFVHSVEGSLYLLSQHNEMHWGNLAELNHVFGGEFSSEKREISFYWQSEGQNLSVVFSSATNVKQMAYGLHVYLLLCRASTLLSADYVVSKLKQIHTKS
ncbi:hypothetical protein CAP2UW1_4400 [Candidatus Accumulibacter phosphatis]|jgi:hypothetical protein|uniref:Uncharacterized protein n=1 Tax=Accumulibacter regalis TaxID=522306 RepID=C7RRC3_ACCRE